MKLRLGIALTLEGPTAAVCVIANATVCGVEACGRAALECMSKTCGSEWFVVALDRRLPSAPFPMPSIQCLQACDSTDAKRHGDEVSDVERSSGAPSHLDQDAQ